MKKIIIPAIVLGIAASASAQNQSLSTTITVDRTAEKSSVRVQPLSGLLPEIPSDKDDDTSVHPAHIDAQNAYSPSVAQAHPANSSAFNLDGNSRGYLWGGYGPAYHLTANAGYAIIRNKDTRLDAAAFFRGNSYTSATAAAQEDNLTDNSLGAEVRLMQKIKSLATLNFDTHYTFAALNGPLNQGSELSRNINTVTSTLRVEGTQVIPWYASAQHYFFGINRGIPGIDATAGDVMINVNAGTVYPITDDYTWKASLDAQYSFLRAHGAEYSSALKWHLPHYNESSAFSITPAAHYSIGQFKAKAGVCMDFDAKGGNTTVYLAPVADVRWAPSQRIQLYAAADGGQQVRNQEYLYSLSPFFPAFAASQRFFNAVDAHIGASFSPVRGLCGSIYGGYAYSENVLMPTGSGTAKADIPAWAPATLKGFRCGASLAYTYSKLISTELNADLYPAGGYYLVADRASAVLKARVDITPVDALKFNIGYTLRTGRHCYGLGVDSESSLKLGNYNGLRIGASYAISKDLSLWMDLDNVLNSRPLLNADLHMEGLRAMAGAAWKF